MNKPITVVGRIKFICWILWVYAVSASCNKSWYTPGLESPTEGEWIYSVRMCTCGAGNGYWDTIWPTNNSREIISARFIASGLNASRDINVVHFFQNDELIAIKQFNNVSDGSNANFIGNTGALVFEFFNPNESFSYSLVANGRYASPDFPFKSDEYQNEMDTFTVNFFRKAQ